MENSALNISLTMSPHDSDYAPLPLKVNTADMQPLSRYEPDFQEVRDIFEREMKCSLIGPQPVQQFLDMFLPLSDIAELDLNPTFYSPGVTSSGTEKVPKTALVCVVFVTRCSNRPTEWSILQSDNVDATQSLHGVEMKHKTVVTENPKLAKPHLCKYLELDLEYGKCQILVPHPLWDTKNKPEDILGPDGEVEILGGATESDCGHMSEYASQMMSAYPHDFFFAVFVFADRARLLRLDNSGGVVTTSFSYKEKDYLSQFLLRYSKLGDHYRGVDPTAVIATPTEAQLLSKSLAEYKERLAPRNTDYLDATLNKNFPAYRINVKSKTLADKDIQFDLIVQSPFSDSQSLVGRCTRGYAAYHVQEERLVSLKDYWRVDDGVTQSEVDMYKHLFAEGSDVVGLPDIIALGDVFYDGWLKTTFTQELTNPDPDQPESRLLGCPTLDRLVHVRIVQELAIPLDSAENSREAVTAIRDAVVCEC